VVYELITLLCLLAIMTVGYLKSHIKPKWLEKCLFWIVIRPINNVISVIKVIRQNQISHTNSFENLGDASFLNTETQEMRRYFTVKVRRGDKA